MASTGMARLFVERDCKMRGAVEARAKFAEVESTHEDGDWHSHFALQKG
jgi:hypothetical protein